MTHGNVWTPFIKDGKQMMLFCEAWSDGYTSGLGQSLLDSTSKLATIAELNVIFCGSPSLYNPETDRFYLKEEDYVIEGYEDAELDLELVDSAQETMDFLAAGDVESAKNTKFSLTSIDDKLAADIGINAHYLTEAEAWKQVFGNAQFITEAEYVTLAKTEELEFVYDYYWQDDKFLTKCVSGKTDKYYILPLSVAVKYA